MDDIFEDEWFKTDHYSMHSQGIQIEQHLNLQLRKGVSVPTWLGLNLFSFKIEFHI